METPRPTGRGASLFQLNPLLNHLLLFCNAYRGAVERAASRLEIREG